jgi:hypothetical protein
MMNRFVFYKDPMDDRIRLLTGAAEIRWLWAGDICTYIYLIITMFVMFMRPDFPNLAVGLIAFYFTASKSLKSENFKLLLVGVVVAALYDVVWILMSIGSWGGGSKFADGAEVGVRRFCLIASFVSLVFKAPVAVIYWRNAIG